MVKMPQAREDGYAKRCKGRARLFGYGAFVLLGVLSWAAWTERLPCSGGPCREVWEARGAAMVLEAALGSPFGAALAGAAVLGIGVSILSAFAYTRHTGRTLWY